MSLALLTTLTSSSLLESLSMTQRLALLVSPAFFWFEEEAEESEFEEESESDSEFEPDSEDESWAQNFDIFET